MIANAPRAFPQGLNTTVVFGCEAQESGPEGPVNWHIFRELKLPAPSVPGDLELSYKEAGEKLT